jgi:hypothetical protein
MRVKIVVGLQVSSKREKMKNDLLYQVRGNPSCDRCGELAPMMGLIGRQNFGIGGVELASF